MNNHRKPMSATDIENYEGRVIRTGQSKYLKVRFIPDFHNNYGIMTDITNQEALKGDSNG